MHKRLLTATLLAALVVCPARATLTTTTSVAQYTSNGVTTAYSYPYRFLDASHLLVTKTDLSSVTTTLVLGTDYTATGANLAAGGTVTLTAAIPNGWTLKIKRSTPKTQPTNLRGQGQYLSASVESALDRTQMQIQEMNDGTFTQLVATPITTAQATTAAPVTIPNSANTNAAGSSSAFAAADHSHALAVGPMAAAKTSVGQSIPGSGVFTIVVFGSVERDTDSAYNNGTGRYTVPVGKGGDYEACGTTSWNTGFTATSALSIWKNAVETRTYVFVNPVANQSLHLCAHLNLAAGDVIDLRAYNGSAGAVTLTTSVLQNWFTLKRIQ